MCSAAASEANSAAASEANSAVASASAPVATADAFLDKWQPIVTAAVEVKYNERVRWSDDKDPDVKVAELQALARGASDSPAAGEAASQRVMMAATGQPQQATFPAGPIRDSSLPDSLLDQPALPTIPSPAATADTIPQKYFVYN